MKETKRVLAALTTLCMAALSVPANTAAGMTEVRPAIVAYAAETSGTCGEYVTWQFDETSGTLTIEGTGAMEAEYMNGDTPYFAYLKHEHGQAAPSDEDAACFFIPFLAPVSN